MPVSNGDLYALCHMETGRLICAQKDGKDYVICFTKQCDAEEFRDALGVRDHCKIIGQPGSSYPIQRFYLDEEFVELGCSAIVALG